MRVLSIPGGKEEENERSLYRTTILRGSFISRIDSNFLKKNSYLIQTSFLKTMILKPEFAKQKEPFWKYFFIFNVNDGNVGCSPTMGTLTRWKLRETNRNSILNFEKNDADKKHRTERWNFVFGGEKEVFCCYCEKINLWNLHNSR